MSTATDARIVCPEWCAMTRKDHLEQLEDPIADGDAVHKSAPAAQATVMSFVRADGVPQDDDGLPAIYVHDAETTVPEAEQLIRELQAAVVAVLRA